MLVSWNWLQQYVPLKISADEVVTRLMMAGLNHESTTAAGDDLAIDLEITSNRPDCLGHLGIAREIGVLFDLPVKQPAAAPRESSASAADLTKVRIDCLDLCPRYSARVIRGIKIGPSPAWMVRRLDAIGVAAVNNVVDITNYVMLECGQPLHAFDFAKLKGRQIIVREARAKEPFVAIDHRTYTLEPGICVIADAESAVAIAGVMGGEYSEVSPATTELLIESAEFAPLAIRTAARKLNLHSPSSYRFERGVDPAGLDWASRRCCELILELAGGELAAGCVAVGRDMPAPARITLRLSQLPRILGIDVPKDAVQRILTALGNTVSRVSEEFIEVTAPTWRRDLTREIDLVEEVARIYGYDKIPEDVAVPMCPSHRRDEDRILSRVRSVLTAAGLDEAMTASVVPTAWFAAFNPWNSPEPLVSGMPMLKGADHLRVSLIPSLLEARRVNEAVSNPVIELFETARVYLPQADRSGRSLNGPPGGGQPGGVGDPRPALDPHAAQTPGRVGDPRPALPVEQWTLGLTSGSDFAEVKGIVESVLQVLHCNEPMEVWPGQLPLLDPRSACTLKIRGKLFGFIGELTAAGQKQFGLRSSTTIAELNLDVLAELARLVPQYSELSPYPAIARDMNLIVDEAVRWSELAESVRNAGGPLLESLVYRETYRDPQRDGPGKKRLLLSCTFRADDRTFTSEEADRIRDNIVAACARNHAAKLLA